MFSFKFILGFSSLTLLPLFATSVIYTGGKFTAGAGVLDTGGNLPLASLTPVASLLPVLLTPLANLPPVSTTLAKLVAKFAAGVVYTGGKFAASAVDTGGKFATGVDTGGAP
jgi:hypothetical protein